MKIKQIQKMAKENEGGAFYCSTKKGILIAKGSELPVESCCVIWKNDDKFYGAYAGSFEEDNPLHFTKADIRFGGTPDFLKIKIDQNVCDAVPALLLLRLNPAGSSGFCGAYWIKSPSENNPIFGTALCPKKNDFLAIQCLFLNTYKVSEVNEQKPTLQMTTNPERDLIHLNEEIIVKIGGED